MSADENNPDNAELRDHIFDGIQEYDNNLPLWWQAILYLSILWAVLYVGWYHLGPGKLGPEKLEAELAAVEEIRLAQLAEMGELNEETLREFAGEESRIAAGRELYKSINCAQCHLASGLGQTGPNLRDDYWKWGSNMMDIYESLDNGRNGGLMPGNNIPRDELINLTVYLVHWNKTAKANGQGVRIEGEELDPIEY